MRVLIADDHVHAREALQELLALAHGVEVVGAATNGREAVEMAAALQPDLVIMDVRMPDVDGVTATQHIKEAHPEIRVIAYSAFPDSHAMRSAGAEEFVTKGTLDLDKVAR